jgi:2-methylisocitrate lyase-like PEP mutase family enzyme
MSDRTSLKTMLRQPEIVLASGVYDALTASLATDAGFRALYLSGASIAYTRLGRPDIGLVTMSEVADTLSLIRDRVATPLIVDADTGYGNALNVMRTVEELEHAGVSLLTIEDLVMPQRFRAAHEFELVSCEEMTAKLHAALAARRDPTLVIAARTAALKGEDTTRTVARAKAYAATGVDAIFITGLKKLSDFDAVRAVVTLPIIVGTAPEINREDLAARGVRVLLQGHPPVRAVVKALREVYTHLYEGGSPADLKPKLASLQDMDALMRNAEYAEWMRTYLQ